MVNGTRPSITMSSATDFQHSWQRRVFATNPNETVSHNKKKKTRKKGVTFEYHEYSVCKTVCSIHQCDSIIESQTYVRTDFNPFGGLLTIYTLNGNRICPIAKQHRLNVYNFTFHLI